jgi:predicted Zn-dependent protease
MNQTAESLFEQGVKRYQAGEQPTALIPIFQEICDRAPKNSPAWTCLAWLYLLADKPNQGYKAAQKAIKLNPQDAQAHINLAIAMLETGQKGVRQQVDMAQQLMMVAPEIKDEVKQNFAEGLSRKPNWSSLNRVKAWTFAE